MSILILRYNRAVLLGTALALFLVIGCGDKSKSDISAEIGLVKGDDEVELFAKAQELQKLEKYEDAVRTYRKIVREYPDSRKGANSQFMIGYIYANHIKDFEQAKIELNRFLDKFGAKADSGLVEGAKFELLYMGMDIDEIPILSDIGREDTVATQAKEGNE